MILLSQRQEENLSQNVGSMKVMRHNFNSEQFEKILMTS